MGKILIRAKQQKFETGFGVYLCRTKLEFRDTWGLFGTKACLALEVRGINGSVTEEPIQAKFLIQLLILRRVFEGVGVWELVPSGLSLPLGLCSFCSFRWSEICLKTFCDYALCKLFRDEDLQF